MCGIISLAGIPKQLTFGEAQLIVYREILLEQEHRIPNETVGTDDIWRDSVVVVDRCGLTAAEGFGKSLK